MRRGFVVTVVAVCAWVAAAAGCSLISTEGFSGGSLPTPPEGGSDVVGSSPVSDAGQDGAEISTTSETGSKSCPTGRGPEMLNLGSFCIDKTEVTQAQYQAFLAEKGTDPNGQPPRCAWNVSYQPLSSCNFNPSSRANYPVAGVDWCDAFAFCAWAGKRMCGKIGGGRLPGGGVNPAVGRDPMQSQWTYACTKGGDGQHKYAYGNTYIASACTTPGSGRSQPTEVGSQSQCVGGFPGLFDMIGNVSEWEDNCDDNNDANPEKDRCYHRGGNIAFGPYDCFELELDERSHLDDDCEWGIRCCADL